MPLTIGEPMARKPAITVSTPRPTSNPAFFRAFSAHPPTASLRLFICAS